MKQHTFFATAVLLIVVTSGCTVRIEASAANPVPTSSSSTTSKPAKTKPLQQKKNKVVNVATSGSSDIPESEFINPYR